MANQKLETLLNLALEADEAERKRSGQLGVGFSEDTGRWELIVKYHGSLEQLASDVISIEPLINGYCIAIVRDDFIDAFADLDEVEYIEKPKRLYFDNYL